MPRRDANALFVVRKPPKRLPFDFVLEELAVLDPWTRPMFGCHAVYVEDKIVFVLRDKGGPKCDDGVWIATTVEHHETLRAEMPTMRSISVLAGGGVTGWQVLPADAEDFEGVSATEDGLAGTLVRRRRRILAPGESCGATAPGPTGSSSTVIGERPRKAATAIAMGA